MKRPAKIAALGRRLDAIYARLPAIACRGECAVGCSSIVLTDLEAQRLQAATHVKPRTVLLPAPVVDAHGNTRRQRCVYLDVRDRCRAYAVRPLICRVFGLVRMLSCPRGCVPDQWLMDTAFVALAREVAAIGDRPTLLMTTPQGLVDTGDGFHRLIPMRPVAEINADAERTRTLRALHGGRIQAAVTKGPGR
jgi:Fe-S-cluster containining protein